MLAAVSLLLACSSLVQQAEERLTIVALGDSTTAWRDTVERVWAARLPELLAERGVPAWVVNAGVPGDTSRGALARLERDVLVHRPDLVVVQFGLNDATGGPRVPAGEFAENLARLAAAIRDRGALPVLMTPNPGGDAELGPWLAVVRELAARAELPLVDVHALLAAEPDPATWRLDDWHPDDTGHARIAAALADAIAALVETGRVRPWPLLQPRLGGRDGHVLVAEGRALDVRPGGREAEVRAPYLFGAGDFRIEARLTLAEFAGTAAALRLGDSWFGFDGRDRRLFTAGPIFGGRTMLRQPAADFLQPGEPFTVEVVRRGPHLRVSLNGQPVAAGRADGAVGGCALRPLRGDLRVLDLRLAGDLQRTSPPPPRGWSVPFVDLAAERARQVVVDREPGQYLGHPTTVLLDDGRTILCVYPEGHGRGAIRYRRSVDGGRTWSNLLPVPDSWATSKEVPTIYKVRVPGGGRRLLLFSGLYPIRMAHSEDEGRTWSELEPIGDYGGIVAMASLVEVPGGDLLAFFHDDGRFLHGAGRVTRFQVFCVRSTDGGLHWREPQVVVEHPDAHLCEPGAVWSPNGRILALLLRENSRRHNSFLVLSDDGGRSWSPPRELPGALTGDRHTARYAPDGRLVVTFRDTCLDSPTLGDWVAWVGTWEDLVAGREGQYRVRLMDNQHAWDCAYPGLELLPDGTFVATTYGHWAGGEEPWIVAVRFQLEELDARVSGSESAPDSRRR